MAHVLRSILELLGLVIPGLPPNVPADDGEKGGSIDPNG
jgi:hypothetical protein